MGLEHTTPKMADTPEMDGNAPHTCSGGVSDMLDCVINNQTLVDRLTSMGFQSKNPSGMTYKEAVFAQQVLKASKGDSQAYNSVMGSLNKNASASPLDDFIRDFHIK